MRIVRIIATAIRLQLRYLSQVQAEAVADTMPLLLLAKTSQRVDYLLRLTFDLFVLGERLRLFQLFDGVNPPPNFCVELGKIPEALNQEVGQAFRPSGQAAAALTTVVILGWGAPFRAAVIIWAAKAQGSAPRLRQVSMTLRPAA
jgi:hypothetical protein